MEDTYLLEYQAIRASLGLPAIPDSVALEEFQALVNFIMLTGEW